MKLSAHILPNYVREFLGRGIPELVKLGPGAYLVSGRERGLIVVGTTAQEARDAAARAVCHLQKKTDRRRRLWFYN